MRFFDKYTGFWRRWKFVYLLNNILHLDLLKKNKSLYKKYGLNRPVWASLSSKHFNHLPKSDANLVSNANWERDGFLKLPGFISKELVNDINREIKACLEAGTLDFNYTGRKILFAYEKATSIKNVIKHPALIEVLNELVGGEVVPFQSINFMYGSEQKAHSDSIHMTSYPEGGLIAIWLALDKIDEENGPLFYYPGSHKLPYVQNADIKASTGSFLSPNPNKLYEGYVEKLIEEKGLKKEIYNAEPGDVLIWHANLIHGGMPHLQKDKTRRSLVVHYFKRDVICYHEISQRPALIKPI